MNLRRAAANAAILIGLSMILMFFVWMVLIPGTGVTMTDMMNPAKVGDFALSHGALWTLGCISDVVCGLSLPFVTIALYRKFRHTQPARATVIGIFGVMASALFFAAGNIALLAPNFVRSLPNAGQIFGSLGAIQQPLDTAAVFLISVATWNAVRAAHATKAFNAVTLYSGYIASLGVLSLPLGLIGPEAANYGMAPAIFAIVYNFGLAQNFMNAAKNKDLEMAMAS
jgi:hypothetical protein